MCRCSDISQHRYGYLIDGVIPSIDTTTSTWASQLYTWKSGYSPNLLLGFEFETNILLREVEVYIFYCPAWSIGYPKITFYIGRDFPNFIELVGGDLGHVTLTSDMQDCENIIKVSIPLRIDHESTTFSIKFETSSQSSAQWVHIAEVRFSDQLIPVVTTPNPTTMSPGEYTKYIGANTFCPFHNCHSINRVAKKNEYEKPNHCMGPIFFYLSQSIVIN